MKLTVENMIKAMEYERKPLVIIYPKVVMKYIAKLLGIPYSKKTETNGVVYMESQKIKYEQVIC